MSPAPKNGPRTGVGPMTHMKRCRLQAGLRQSDVAAAAGCSRQTIWMLEAGDQVPRLSTAVAIAKALGHDDPRVVFPELVQAS